MPSPFAEDAAMASDTIAGVFGEAFRFEPRIDSGDVNGDDQADPSRVVVEPVIAIFRAPAARADSGPARMPGVVSNSPGVISSRPVVTVQASKLPWRPQTNDRLVRLETGEAFRVAETKPWGVGDLWMLDLNLEETQP